MEQLPKEISQNGIRYTLVGDYYIPDLQRPEEKRPIEVWGRMHKAYLELYHQPSTMTWFCPVNFGHTLLA